MIYMWTAYKSSDKSITLWRLNRFAVLNAKLVEDRVQKLGLPHRQSTNFAVTRDLHAETELELAETELELAEVGYLEALV